MNIIKKILLAIICLLISFSFIKKEKVTAGEPVLNLPQLYRQNDPRWGSHVNGNGTIASSACGLLSLVNSVNYITGNFINPVELADYAYSIDAYNTPEGGGTWREVLYRDIPMFEEKYGFKVTNPSIWATIKDERLRNHLKKGGVSVAHVDGHFIAIVGYDQATNSYLVYDSADNVDSRHDYACGTWMTENELGGDVAKMIVDWFCLLEKNIVRKTQLDSVPNLSNGKAETTFYVIKDDAYSNNPVVGGYCLTNEPIAKYYYVMDYNYDNLYPLDNDYRDIDTTGYVVENPDMIGFTGVINTTSLSLGDHYVNIFAETTTGKVINIAEVEVKVGKNSFYQDGKFVIDASSCAGQTDVLSNWPAASINDYVFAANYATTLNLGRIDLSLYKKALIYYSTSSSFVSNKSGVQSIIGLKSCRSYFGYYGKNIDLKASLAYTNMTNGTSGGWQEMRVAEVDLTNVNRFGSVYLNGYNQEGQQYAVTKVEFVPYNTSSIPTHNEAIKVNGTYEVSSVSNNYLGTFDLSNVAYIELVFDNAVNGNVTIETGNACLRNKVIDNATKCAFRINANTTSNVYVMGANVVSATLYDKNQDAYFIRGVNNHQELQYHDGDTAVYKDVDHLYYVDNKPATCLTVGSYKETCVYCGHVGLDTVLLPLGHEASAYQSLPSGHYKVCDRCGEKFDEGSHIFTNTYNEYYHYEECVCGYVQNMQHHEFDEAHKCTCGYECTHEYTKKIKGVAATCSEDGYTEGVECSICGAIVSGHETIKAGHNFVDGECTRCGEKENNSSPKQSGCALGSIAFINFAGCAALLLIRKKH